MPTQHVVRHGVNGTVNSASLHAGSYGSFASMGRYGAGAMPQAGLPVGRLGQTIRPTADPYLQQQFRGDLPAAVVGVPDKEREPLLVKAVRTEEGKVEVMIVGQSTLPQTVFNSVNVLIGIGLLSLPLGLRYSGW